MKHFVFFKRCLILLILFIFFDFIISILLINGLNKYYGFNQKPEILINGSSMAMAGFNRDEIEKSTGMRIVNYSHEGVSVNDRYAMISHFFQKYTEGVKIVVYEVNPVVFSNGKTAENVYTIFYPYMDDKTIDKYIKENASIKEYYTNKIIRTKRFDSRLIRLIIMGYLGKCDNLKTNTMDTTALLPLIAQKRMTEVNMVQSNIEVFENTMDLIRSHKATIVIVMMPMYYIKLQTFNNEGYSKLCNYFKEYCSSRENIKFMDFNQNNIIYNGQRYITKMISSHLTEN
jgi:hypothetical protein